MRLRLLLVPLILAIPGAAFADASSPQITNDDPSAGLPAISKDGASFVRQVRVQPSGCTGIQTYAEVGTVGGPSTETKSNLLLVRDECSSKSAGAVEKNITSVNATLQAKAFRTVGTMATQSLPATIDAPEGTFKIEASGKQQCTVGVEGSTADRWKVTLEGEITEVRGWYSGKSASGTSYVAIQVSTDCDDTGRRGRERWVDFWPVAKAATDGDSPVDVATRWLAALKQKDAAALASLTSAPFFKVGLAPVSGKQAKKCKKLHKAKRERDLKKVAACMVLAGAIYTRFSDKDAIADIDLGEFPEELKKHKKAVVRLLKKGHKLVKYFMNDQGFYISLVFLLDPDTDFQTVSAVLESIDIEDEEE